MFLPENLLDRRGHECELELRLALAPMDMFVTMDVAFILFQILDEGRGLSIKSYVAVRADLRSLAVSMARVQISSLQTAVIFLPFSLSLTPNSCLHSHYFICTSNVRSFPHHHLP